MSGIEATDKAAAAHATAPRVSLAAMEAKIVSRLDMTGDQLPGEMGYAPGLHRLSICVLLLTNGYILIGKSAPASEANFDRELGKQFAYEDAIRQLWPLEGYALREKLSA